MLIFPANSPADLAPVATFAVFVIIAVVQHDHSLLTAQAFTTLSLVSLLTSPALAFIQAVPSIIQCIGCFNRIQEYCSAPPASLLTAPEVATPAPSVLTTGDLAEILDASREGSAINLQTLSQEIPDVNFTLSQHLVSFRNCSFGWTKTDGPILKDITVDIETNFMTMIVGSIGSGKSTFLESVLGETLELQGHTLRSGASIAYCSQTAWLTNQSVRSNIVGAADIDEDWYASVLWACGLESDFAQMAQGDRTNVGSNGVNLSGGQKQRIVSFNTNWRMTTNPPTGPGSRCVRKVQGHSHGRHLQRNGLAHCRDDITPLVFSTGVPPKTLYNCCPGDSYS